MKLLGLALACAVAMAAGDVPRFVVPDSPDLTIRTRLQTAGPRRETITIRLKGARQLIERTLDGDQASAYTTGPIIAQCDRRRTLILNRERRTYGYVPILEPSSDLARRQAVVAVAVPETSERQSTQQITIDAVDTGERRQFGALTARHVVTTTRTELDGNRDPISTRVQDGWYVDLPPAGCVDSGRSAAFVFLASGYVSGSRPPPMPRITFRGRAKAGVALIETDRTVSRHGDWTQTTELLEISDAPLDASLFDVPEGYRPALPQWGGGFDLNRPDTLVNRAMLLWEGVRDLTSRFWR